MNPQKIIRDFITVSGSDLYTLVGLRVWHSGYPDSSLTPDGSAFIVFNLIGTDTPTNGQTELETVEFKCHGGDRTASSGQAVERALYDVLHCKGNANIHRAARIGRLDTIDPETKWRYTLGRYNLLIQE